MTTQQMVSTKQITSSEYAPRLQLPCEGDYFQRPSIPRSDGEDSRDRIWQEKELWFDVTSRCDRVLDELPAMGVFLPNIGEVAHYLLLCPDMIDLLEPVCEAALARFPCPSQVALELFKDPESDDQYLTVCVRQHEYDEDILDVLDEVSAPFDDVLCGTSGWLLVTTDFQDPL